MGTGSEHIMDGSVNSRQYEVPVHILSRQFGEDVAQ